MAECETVVAYMDYESLRFVIILNTWIELIDQQLFKVNSCWSAGDNYLQQEVIVTCWRKFLLEKINKWKKQATIGMGNMWSYKRVNNARYIVTNVRSVVSFKIASEFGDVTNGFAAYVLTDGEKLLRR